MKKRFLALTLALAMTSALLAGCGGSSAPAASAGSASGSGSAAPAEPAAELTATQKIIAEAEGMTLEELAKKAIDTIVFVPEVGSLYYGKVVRILKFGAFVELAPGKDGMVHISKLADHRIGRVEDAVNVGDMIWVKVTDIDEKGRVNLSHIDAIREIKAKKLAKQN